MASIDKHMHEINIKFATCSDLKTIKWLENTLEENPSLQEKIINATINHPLCQKYPPPLKYRKKFIKTLINKIEETNHEVSEESYDIYLKLLNESEDEEVSFRTYYTQKYDLRIILEENKNIISNSTTGLRTWEASFYFSDWCLANKNVFHKKRILELGCGIGFTGIAVTLCCKPSTYCFTDVHDEVLEQLQRNININIMQNNTITDQNVEVPNVDVIKVDWTDDSWDLKDYDILIAADVVYDPEIIPHLVKTINKLLETIPVAYIACTIRNVETTTKFLEALELSQVMFEKNVDEFESTFNHFNSPFAIWKLYMLK